MFSVGMIVACFYVWSGQDAISLDATQVKSEPKKLLAKILALHKKEEFVTSAKIEDSSLEAKTEKKEVIYLELETNSKKIRYFINASSCTPSPMTELTKVDQIEPNVILQKEIKLEKIETQEIAPKKEEQRIEKKEELANKEQKQTEEDPKLKEKTTEGDGMIKQISKDIIRGIGIQ